MGDNTYDLESNKYESSWDECSMLGAVASQSSNNVFPPVNHEDLQIHLQTFPQSLHHFNPATSPSKIPDSRFSAQRNPMSELMVQVHASEY